MLLREDTRLRGDTRDTDDRLSAKIGDRGRTVASAATIPRGGLQERGEARLDRRLALVVEEEEEEGDVEGARGRP